MLDVLISFILRSPRLRALLLGPYFRKLADAWLHRFPLLRSLPETGLTYRMSSLDSVGVAREIFYHGAYDQIRPLLRDVRTVADVGCNCGFFTCFVANAGLHSAIQGLLIDANPEMVREADWHVKKNCLSQMHATHGLVGGASEATKHVFYLHPEASGSSSYPFPPEGNIRSSSWQPIEVPALSLATQWQNCFGDTPCDLLKIDIEGSEGDLIIREADFIASVRLVLIEIHHWLVDVNLIENQLVGLGFSLGKLLSSSKDADVRLYANDLLMS